MSYSSLKRNPNENSYNRISNSKLAATKMAFLILAFFSFFLNLGMCKCVGFLVLMCVCVYALQMSFLDFMHISLLAAAFCKLFHCISSYEEVTDLYHQICVCRAYIHVSPGWLKEICTENKKSQLNIWTSLNGTHSYSPPYNCLLWRWFVDQCEKRSRGCHKIYTEMLVSARAPSVQIVIHFVEGH